MFFIEEWLRINDQKINEQIYRDRIVRTELRHLTWNNFLTISRALLIIEPSEIITIEAFTLLSEEHNKKILKLSILTRILIILRPDLELQSASEEEEECGDSKKVKYDRLLQYTEFRQLINDHTFRDIIGAQKSSLNILHKNLEQFRSVHGNYWLQ